MKSILLTLALLSTLPALGSDCADQKPIGTYEPRYAKLFSIKYFKDFKIVQSQNDRFLVSDKAKLDCTTNLPVMTSKVQRFVATSTTHLAFLKNFSLQNTLVGFQGVGYIYDEKIRAQSIKNINYQLNAEELIALKPDLVMAYPSNLTSPKRLKDLRSFQIPVVLNRDFEEKHPLARAEWIVFNAVFFSKDLEAQKFFKEVETNYLKIKNMKPAKRSVVLVGDIQNGKWETCGGESDLAILIADAGGDLLLNKKSSEMQYISLETILSMKEVPAFWLPQNTWKDKSKIKDDSRYNRYNQVPVFNNNKLLSKNGFNDYWETGMSRPDLMLKDLHAIFNQSTTTDLTWYKELK